MVKPANMSSGAGIQNDGFEKDDADEIELNGVHVYSNGHSPVAAPTENRDKGRTIEDDADHLRCGVACFSPDWIQKFATRRSFIIVFSILGIIQSMSWAYFSATLTTLEKRFRLSSQTAGVVMTGNEVSQIVFSIILSYYGTGSHRPRWISVGVMLSAIACFLLASPHILYGSGSTALSYTTSENHLDPLNDRSFLSSIVSDDFQPITTDSNLVPDSFKKGIKKYGQPCFLQGHSTTTCKKNESSTDEYSLLPLVLIFFSQFASGIGNILFFTLGGPYLDDNTKKGKLPMVFGITYCFRLLGPTLGYLLASACLKVYINPLLTPVIDSSDPRWIGAWWLGWILLGCLMALIAFVIALFPRTLQSSAGADTEKQVQLDDGPPPEELVKISELPKAIRVLLTNKTNLFNTLAGVLYLFSTIGYWTYAPKYLETIFLQSASSASITSGTVGIAFQAAGLLGSGFLISKFRPRARLLAGWNVAVAFLHVGIMMVFTQIGCNPGRIEFGTSSSSESQGTYWNLTSECNLDCGCQNNKILPICLKEESKVYFSPCHAGCEKIFPNGTLTQCSCFSSPTATAELGTCSEGCFVTFVTYLAVTAMIKLLDSTGRIGNTLVAYRCVDKRDRSLSIGIGIFLISIFALLPAPIVFGAIIDSVCLIWNKSECQSDKGNCLFYNGERLRYVFNITAAVCTFAGGVLDCFVWYYVKDLELYSVPEESVKAGSDREKEDTQKSIKS